MAELLLDPWAASDLAGSVAPGPGPLKGSSAAVKVVAGRTAAGAEVD